MPAERPGGGGGGRGGSRRTDDAVTIQQTKRLYEYLQECCSSQCLVPLVSVQPSLGPMIAFRALDTR